MPRHAKNQKVTEGTFLVFQTTMDSGSLVPNHQNWILYVKYSECYSFGTDDWALYRMVLASKVRIDIV